MTLNYLRRGRLRGVRRFVPLLAALLLLLLLTPRVEADTTYRDKRVDPDDHDEILLYKNWYSDDYWFDIEFRLVEGLGADLYILTEDEIDDHYPNGTFYPNHEWLNRTNLSFKFYPPDTQSYYFVVDNRNTTGNDTFHNETVFYDIDISYEREPYDPPMSDAEALWCCGGGLLIIVITIVVIVVVIYRRKPVQLPEYPPYAPGYPPQYPPQYPR